MPPTSSANCSLSRASRSPLRRRSMSLANAHAGLARADARGERSPTAKRSRCTTPPGPTPTRRPRSMCARAWPPLRAAWIEARADTELYEGRLRMALDDGAKHEAREAERIEALRREAAALQRRPRRARSGANVTQMHYARRGIVTPEMEFVAIRENGKREWMAEYLADAERERRLRGQPMGAQHPRAHHARIRARRSGARPRHHPGQHQPPRDRADGDRPQLPRQDQRQHRQLGGHLEHRGRGGEAGVGDPLGRRQRDGSFHRQEHPHHARLDRAQLAGAHRHGADLPGAGEGGRRGRRPHLGDLSRHADRAGRAGGGLLHHPRGRAAALHPPHRQSRHRHRLARRLDHGQVVHRASQGELPLHALRRHLRHHEGLRRELLARRRPAPRLRRRCQRRGAVRRAAHAGRTDAGRLEARRADHDRRPGPRADAPDPGQHGGAVEALPRSAVLHAGPA